jgi:signal peptidase II
MALARRYKVFLIVGSVILVLDQVTKLWARARLPADHTAIPVINGYWDWRLSYNLGSAFGLLAKVGGARIILTIVGIAACAFIVHVLRKAEDWQKWFTAALGLVAGGAVGNVFDRIIAGKVTDFIVWKIGTHEWPAFNIADAALVAGVVIMFLDLGREQRKMKEKKLAAEEKEREAKQAEKKKAKKKAGPG